MRIDGSFPTTSCIYVANHASIYDTPIVLGTIPRQLRPDGEVGRSATCPSSAGICDGVACARESQESRRRHLQAYAADGEIRRVA
jgi:hypothetical protein